MRLLTKKQLDALFDKASHPDEPGEYSYDDWVNDSAKTTEFEEGDSPEKFLKEGKKELKRQIREESRVGNLRKKLVERKKRRV